VWALCQVGFKHVLVANRTYEKAQALCTDLQETAPSTHLTALSLHEATTSAPRAQLHINAISLGHETANALFAEVPWPEQAWATDLSYKPLKTPFLTVAEQAGCKTVDGLGMLLHQAVPAFERWFGLRPQVEEILRLKLEKSLAQEGEQALAQEQETTAGSPA
jgi:shikimate dehydrogenase